MEMSRLTLILTMKDIYINSNLNPLTKFTPNNRSTKLILAAFAYASNSGSIFLGGIFAEAHENKE